MSELVHGLSLTALVAGSLEYAILVRRREERRHVLRQEEAVASTGLTALVRVLLADQPDSVTVGAYRPE